jgi:putative DNA primase/helicase
MTMTNSVVSLSDHARTRKSGRGRTSDASSVSSPRLISRTNTQEDDRLTDLENAKRLVAKHGSDLRYLPQWGKWLIWDGARWAEDRTQEIERRAKEVVLDLYVDASKIKDDVKRRTFVERARRCESYGRITSMVALARSELPIPVTPDQLDTEPWLLNVPNGTVDLRTGDLCQRRREDLITKLAPVVYDPRAECPQFLNFLKHITGGDVAIIEFLQKVFGYCLTGDTGEQCFFILYGTGANGKSTLLNTIRTILGDYAKHAQTETLLEKRGDGINNDVARLHGARFVDAIEAEGGRRLAEALIKKLTGGDPVTARFLYREHFEFRPTFKLFLAVNHKPPIQGTDHGIWRRIRLIPFEITIPQAQQNKHLGDELLAEAPGILRWMVEGCLAWQRDKGLVLPAKIQAATETYRSEMDVLAQFVSQRCIQRQKVREAATALYAAYTEWCDETGERPVNQREFCSRLKERGLVHRRTKHGYVWDGIELRDEDEE